MSILPTVRRSPFGGRRSPLARSAVAVGAVGGRRSAVGGRRVRGPRLFDVAQRQVGFFRRALGLFGSSKLGNFLGIRSITWTDFAVGGSAMDCAPCWECARIARSRQS